MHIANGSYVTTDAVARSLVCCTLTLFHNNNNNSTLFYRSLSLDEQLHWRWKHETLFIISHLHLDLFGLFPLSLGLELLFLQFPRLHVQSRLGTVGPCHDVVEHWLLSLYLFHAHECLLWNHDGHWNH